MKKIFSIMTMAVLAAMSVPAHTQAQTERQYFRVADETFKRNANTNTADAAANSFTIGQSFGSVYWAMRGQDISGYRALVVRVNGVEGNSLRLILKDRANTEYIHNVDLAKGGGRQEIVVDLMRPLKSEDGTRTLNLADMARISFWNYWDDGDGHPAAEVSLGDMFLEPFGGEVSIANPIVQTRYTTDPAPMVYGDRLYVFTGHDDSGATYFEMNDWRLYSTTDMVNWTDHGSPMDWHVYDWCKGQAWAAQAVERNGKIYWYTSSEHNQYGCHVVGVAVADRPEGPYTAGRSTSLTKQWGDIDPTVFVDTDGQAYLYWGNNCLRYGLLNDDMVSLKDGPHEVELTAEAFGGVKIDGKVEGADCFEEGPWLTRHADTYYMVYAAGGVPEHLAYSTSASPTGPWTYRGVIMPTQGGSFTNHPGIIDYKGHTYLFYHNGALPGGGGFQRSVCVEEFKYNADGTIPQMGMTGSGVKPVGTLCPYLRTEAETMAWSYGLTTEQETGGMVVTDIDAGDYLTVREVDFGTEGAAAITAMVKGMSGGMVSVYADNPKGEPLAQINVEANSGWKEIKTALRHTLTGKHDLYFVFGGSGSNMMRLDWWQFAPAGNTGIAEMPAAGVVDSAIYTLGGVCVAEPQHGLNIKNGRLFVSR